MEVQNLQEKRAKIRERLNRIFQEVFDDESIDIFDEMTAVDIEEWDSLMHITLIVAAEKEFNVRLNAAEVGNLENVGSFLALLMDRT